MAFAVYAFLLAIIATGTQGDAVDHGRRVVCFFGSWAVRLSVEGRFDVPDAEPAMSMCTHLIYLFANLDGDSFKVKYEDAARDVGMRGIEQTIALKKKHPHLKVMIGIGGWNDGSISYSRMARQSESRKSFVDSAVAFILKHSLDGMDLNWQFPGDRGGGTDDRDNVIFLVKELREAMDKHGKLLSVSVPCIPFRIQLGIKNKEIADHAHFLNVLTYEYHGWWEGKVQPGTPLYSNDEFSINNTITTYLNMGIDPDKLNLGLSSYLMTFILQNPIPPGEKNITGRPLKNWTFKGPLTGVDGFMAYNELCKETDEDNKWRFELERLSQTTYAFSEDRLVSFDIASTYAAKVRFAMEKKLGGVQYYGIEKDDFRPFCKSSKEKFPILRSIDQSLIEYSPLVFEDLLLSVKQHNAHYFWNGGLKD